jgi:S-adenosylmethionine:tRNA ribosyltransferase-isomerase
MVLDRRKKTITDAKFTDIVDYLQKGDVLVINDTKVFPAKLYGHKEKTSAKIEVFLLRELNKQAGLWDVLVEPARKVRVGNKIYFPEDLVAEVVDNTTSRGRTIRFLNPEVDIFQVV